MQVESPRRSNQERTDATRAALIAAARRLFVEKGYASTGTPEIVEAAQVTRGALYHHFVDKAELFLAVARQCAEEVASDVAGRSRNAKSPLDALTCGAEAYFAAMADGGRARLLLLEAPSILSLAQRQEISELAGAKELQEGLAQALPANVANETPLPELTSLVSAAFDQAALAIAAGASPKKYKAAMRLLLTQLVRGAEGA
jgi:AcrR family transcriptional regulator